MSKLLSWFLILVMASGGAAWAQDPKPAAAAAAYGGNFFVGTRGLDNANYLGRVSEYEVSPQGLRPSLGAGFWAQRDGLAVDFRGEHRGDARDQQYELRLDAGRYFRLRTSYERFVHRLGHDPLLNLDTAKGTVVVRYDDLTPAADYVPGRSQVRTEITGAIPGVPWLVWRAGHRSQLQHGDVQARTLSKCANCHVVGTTKRIDQRLHELSAGLTVRASRLTLEYSYLNRQFNERGATPYLVYDVAIHPQTQQRIFANRVTFDAAQGALPFSLVPDVRKSAHELKAALDLPRDARWTAALVSARAENKHSGLRADSLGAGAKFTLPLGKRLSFTARVRKLDVDSDPAAVDLNENVSPEGPQAGKTFSQAYPSFGPLDYVRPSVASRSELRASAEVGARLARLTSLRAGYQFTRLRRDHFEVERTGTSRVFAGFSTRSSKTWSGRLRYSLEHTTDPFTHRHAALSPVMQPSPSPGSPPSPLLGLQYFTMYAARQAHLTNQPTRSHGLEPSWTWSPSDRFSFTAHYRLRTEKNDRLNFSDWQRDLHMPGAELWIAPLARLNFTAAYTFQHERSRTLFVLPAFDG
jgi:hypothetical protein